MRIAGNDFLGLIALAAAGARGDGFSSIVDDWRGTVQLAGEQSVIPLLGNAILKNPHIVCPDEIKGYLISSLRTMSSMNMIRRQRSLNLLQQLRTEGFQVQVIKGYVIAESYAYPESRSSVDMDILIPSEQENDVCNYLREKEFVVEARSLTSHHTVCKHRKYGVIEVHVNLYDELVEEIWFQDKANTLVQEKPVEITAVDGRIPTLGYTDHFLFLTLHMIKHFISGGMGLGMMLDIGLYYRQYRELINMNRVWNVLEELNYAIVLACVMQILKEYGGFYELDDAGYCTVTDEQIELLLSDVENGGRMGVKEQDARVDSAYAYNQLLALKTRSKLSYYSYMLKWKLRATVRAIFPTKAHLEMRYPYTKGKPLMLPIAWLQRFLSGCANGLKKDKTGRQIRTENSKMTQVSTDRLELFRKLEMI